MNTLKITIFFVFISGLFFLSGQIIIAKKVTCSVFKNQLIAQMYFDSDPYRFRSLDRDKDKRACENLPIGFIVK